MELAAKFAAGTALELKQSWQAEREQQAVL
jgi:hypothetical protein